MEKETSKTELLQRIALLENKIEKLEKTNSVFSALANSTAAGICIVENEKFVYVNPALETITGYTADELLGRKFHFIIHPDYLEKVTQEHKKRLQGKPAEPRYEICIMAKNGTNRLLDFSVTLIEEDGKKKAIATFHDITKIKERVKLFKRLSTAVLHNPGIVVIVDSRSKIVFANPKFSQITGYSLEEVKGQNPRFLKSGFHANRFYKEMWNTLHEGKNWEGEFYNRKKNGDCYWEKAIITPVTHEDGEKNYLKLSFDITKQKHAEQELKWELTVQTSLARLSNALMKNNLSIIDICNIVLEEAKLLTDSEHGYVGSIEKRTKNLHVHTFNKMQKNNCNITEEDQIIEFRADENGKYGALWGHVLNTKEPFYTNEPPFHRASRGLPPGHVQMDNFLSVPVILSGKLVGQIALANSETGYNKRQLASVQRLAEIYGLALDNKKAEQAIKMSENKFRTVFNSASAGIGIITTDGQIREVNQKMVEMFGYTADEFKKKSIFDLSNQKYNKINIEKIEQLKRGKINSYSLEKEYKRKDGSTFWAKIYSTPILNENNEIEQIIGIIIDITQQKQAAKKEREYNKNLLLLNASAVKFLSLTNEQKIYEYIAKSIQSIITDSIVFVSSYNPENNTRKIEQIAGLDNLKDMAKSVLQDEPLGLQFEISEKEKELQLIRKIHDFDVGFIKKNIADFSVQDYEHAREALNIDNVKFVGLAHSNRLLGSIVIILRNKNTIGNPRLIETFSYQAAIALQKQLLIRELNHSNATKDKFFSIIAHDLKNPFSTILGFSELLIKNSKKYDTEKMSRFAQMIRQSSESGYKLLENLLEWSRSQTGTIRFSPTGIELAKLVREAVGSNIITAKEKQISLKIEIPDETSIYADREMISTVIRNLVSNAVKFTPAEGEIRITATSQNSNTVLVSVSDTGIGIKKAAMDKLFRIDINHSTLGTDGEKGTGLGLILCKEFVEKNRGRIWVESETDKGSTFYFTLPAANKPLNQTVID